MRVAGRGALRQGTFSPSLVQSGYLLAFCLLTHRLDGVSFVSVIALLLVQLQRGPFYPQEHRVLNHTTGGTAASI